MKAGIVNFLGVARAKTYASGSGKVGSVFTGMKQLEYGEKDWFYRDLYNLGNKIFMGLETVYFKEKPVWSMCYFGDFKEMSEEEVDKILREALVEKSSRTRLWYKVRWEKDNFLYKCTPDFPGSIEEMAGLEEIYRGKKRVYMLYYAGGFIG